MEVVSLLALETKEVQYGAASCPVCLHGGVALKDQQDEEDFGR